MSVAYRNPTFIYVSNRYARRSNRLGTFGIPYADANVRKHNRKKTLECVLMNRRAVFLNGFDKAKRPRFSAASGRRHAPRPTFINETQEKIGGG